MKKEEINEFMNMTLQEKKDKIIEIIREIPEDSPIHKELYETLKDGAVEVKGSTTVLMADLSMIIKLLRETFEEEDIPKETGDKLIRKAVDVGFWTEDKLDKELSNMRAEVLGKLMGLALSSIWGGAKDE